MKFRLNRNDPKQQRSLTPWEKYQAQAQRKREHAKTPSWIHKAKRIGDKLPRLKHERTRKLVRRLSILLGSFTAVILVMVYLVSPLSHFRTVRVTGNVALSAAQVQRAAQVQPGNSIFQLLGHTQQLEKQAVKRNTRVKHVTIHFKRPNHATIHVTEFMTAGYVLKQNRYYEVLENGIVSEQSVTQPKSGTPVYGSFKRAKTLHRMILQYAQLSPTIKRSISEIQESPTKANPDRVHLFMNDGNEVYASIASFANKMAYYPSIAAKMKAKGVVNLEVGAYSYPFSK
ncbi:cell division septal protein [Levilactobacillus koreensis JCM 16448]|uniref:Cell division protein DivIB n=1 Tax=Levilactobacillus koreensis TaxID=637971 RepID=A0AAC9ER90_9LACO|nr:FtsQ-type POTRA domain-containing protein [Levilactobacillus koreensis]AKP65519.1 cell division septal protein [Levilactobacillus koreensis]KRK87438.1 cell division septal protein [Levilactobacillus koreensis JCM 16448]